MKKLIILMAFSALIIYVGFKDSGYNPYSGAYQSKNSSSWVLKLNKNDSFALYSAVGKTSEFIEGKYQVEDNNITLTLDKDNVYKLNTETLHGKVDGSTIKVEELSEDFFKD